MSLTYAYDSISSVSLVTGTDEATRSVGTGSISVTIISISSTLVNIWQNETICYLKMKGTEVQALIVHTEVVVS